MWRRFEGGGVGETGGWEVVKVEIPGMDWWGKEDRIEENRGKNGEKRVRIEKSGRSSKRGGCGGNEGRGY